MLDAAVLIACGADSNGRRDVLGCSVSLSEAEAHWRSFLTSLKDRGLRLVSAELMETAEDWQTADKRYFTFSDQEAVEG